MCTYLGFKLQGLLVAQNSAMLANAVPPAAVPLAVALSGCATEGLPM